MLNDASGLNKIYLLTGYTDLRTGIDGLAAMVKYQFHLEPRDKNTLFLFCGRRSDRIKCLVWEGDGWLLLYKRTELGSFAWPRTESEALKLTEEQFRSLMQGLEIVPKRPIRAAGDREFIM